MFKKEKRYKGIKVYGVMGANISRMYFVSDDINNTKKGLDKITPILVELTVTRVFTRENDLKEIETES